MKNKQIWGVAPPIDATLPEFHNRPLWCVYGPQCFPTMFCCKILHHPQGCLTIWGYSVYRRQPGFRTLGRDLSEWAADHEAVFFAEQIHALQFLANITTPAKGA